MGLYKRPSGVYWLSVTVNGKQHFESCGTHNKKLALKVLAIRLAEIAEGRWNLPVSNPPRLKAWMAKVLQTVQRRSIYERYNYSTEQLLSFFGENTKLSDISVARIEEFKQKRLTSGVKPSTANRDLATLRRALTLAVRQRLIARNPFDSVQMLEERTTRRQPRIISYEEQHKIVAVATPHLRALIILLTETGLRVNKEALQLKWSDVDFGNSQLTVRESKTLFGRRVVPLSELCKAELMRWRRLVGPELSEFVFPSMETLSKPLGCVRKTWSTALRKAKVSHFPI